MTGLPGPPPGGSEPPEASRPFPDPERSITPRKPRTPGGAVYLAVLFSAVVGVVLVTLGPWRLGLTLMGVALLAGGAGRLALPQDASGMLRVRRKAVDVVTLLALGVALVVLAAVIPDQPVP